MMRILLIFLLLWAVPARTAEVAPADPQIGPPPAWVTPAAIPAPNPALRDRPVQTLLFAAEGRYTRDGRFEYSVDSANLIQTPEGLAALGNLVLPWQPDVAALIVHKVRIVRDGKEIDLLKDGRPFTVLRRENNLEAAALDGVLTAVMQAEGLAVGDVLRVSFTLRSKPRAIAFQPEDTTMLSYGSPVRRFHYRQIWEKGVPMRWAATEAMGKPRIRTTDWGTELQLERDDAEGPEVPKGSPMRYWQPARIEMTGYGDWADVSRLLAPVFASAGTLAPDSPLRAEIDRIAKASPDPRQRGMAALRLVQDKVRYFALNIGDGGYVPAPPDQTWSRKFGECKAKTVLLLALLQGLGIEAEPVLVSSVGGDTLAVRMPQVRAFDHVLVRARIGGRDHWLDGTRSGDRDLDALTSTPFRWGLPLRAGGARLEALPLLPPPAPLLDFRVTYDATKGFLGSVPVTGEIVYRGDMATGLRLMHQQMGAEAFARQARQMAPGAPGGDDVQFEFRPDEERGAFIVGFKGTQRMNWTGGAGAQSMLFRFDDDTIRWDPDFRREPGPGSDAPFALPFPVYLESTETVLLPGGGSGFTLDGKSFDRTVAGTQIARTLSLENGRAVARSLFRRLQPEIGAAEARAALAPLKEIGTDVAAVRAPANYQMSETDRKALAEREPTTAQGYNQRGYEFLQSHDYEKALGDFDKAVALSPQWSLPAANRAIALIHLRKFAEARAALEKSAAMPEETFVTWQGWGMLHLAENRPQEAVAPLTKSLGLEPGNTFTLMLRVSAYQQLGQFAEAAADLKRAAEIKPDSGEYAGELAWVEARRGNEAAALAAADRLAALMPDEPDSLLTRARLLTRFGRRDEAAAAYAAALAAADKTIAASSDPAVRRARIQQRADILFWSGQAARAVEALSAELRRRPDDPGLLNSRCWTRAIANLDPGRAIEDCDKALAIRPGSPAYLDSRGLVLLRLGRLDEAIADFGKAIASAPNQAASYYGRGIARLRKGEREAGDKDLATARRLFYDIDAEYLFYGIAP